MVSQKRMLYLRTDIGTKSIIGGGSVAHTLGVVMEFLNAGYDITCVSSAMHDRLQKLQHHSYRFIPLFVPRYISMFGCKISALLSNLFFYYHAEKAIRNDLVHIIYQRYSMLQLAGVWLSIRYKIPLVLEFNGSEIWVDQQWSQRRLSLTFLVRSVEMYNLKHATHIVVVSQVLKDQLIAAGVDATKIVVAPNGVFMHYFNGKHLQQERSTMRKALQLEDKFVIGFSGTFGPWHGIETLVTFIPKLIAQERDVHFLLIGNGQYKSFAQEALQAFTPAHVTFIDMVTIDAMPSYLAACDAFVCPTQPNKDGTRFFGSPTKLFEYMATGKPIVASRIEQVAQLLDIDGVREFLVEPNDIDGFCTSLCKAAHLSPEQRKKLSITLQQQAEQYTWQKHVERIIEVL